MNGKLKYFMIIIGICIIIYGIFGYFNSPSNDMGWYLKKMNINKIHEKYKGKNIKIGIIDSGSTSFIKTEKQYNFSNSKSEFDTISHGSSNINLIKNIAPESLIFSYKVTNQDTTISSQNILLALEQAQKDEVDIIALPMGTHKNSEEVSEKLKELKDNNIILLSSAGDYDEDKLMFPAIDDSVLSVGAISNIRVLDSLQWIMNNDPDNIDVFFPGDPVPIYDDYNFRENNFIPGAGTSYSTAIATGYMALLLEKNENLTIEEIKVILSNVQEINFDYYLPFK